MPHRPEKHQAPFGIHIRLKTIEAFFNSLDPSPLVERDINDTVEDYIVDCVHDAPHDASLQLVLHVPDEAAAHVGAADVRQSVANYFSFLRDRETRRIRHLMREGREAALVGVAFLAACTVGAQALKSVHGGALFSLLAEGLLIIGWVANWRAVSIFLYEWRPMRRKMKDYDRLASLDVQVQPTHT